MELIIIWLACGGFAAVIASSKGHGGCAWFALGFLFGPLALLAAIGIGRNDATLQQRGADAGELKKCPACAEMIRAEAVKCRYCGTELPAPSPTPQTTAQEPSSFIDAPPQRGQVNAFGTIAFIAAALLLLAVLHFSSDETRVERADQSPAVEPTASLLWRAQRGGSGTMTTFTTDRAEPGPALIVQCAGGEMFNVMIADPPAGVPPGAFVIDGRTHPAPFRRAQGHLLSNFPETVAGVRAEEQLGHALLRASEIEWGAHSWRPGPPPESFLNTVNAVCGVPD